MTLRLHYSLSLVILPLLNLTNRIGFLEIHYLGKWTFTLIQFGIFLSILKDGQALQIIIFDKNNDLVIYDSEKSFNIPEKYLQERDQEEIKRSKYLSTEVKGECNNNICQFEFFKKTQATFYLK